MSVIWIFREMRSGSTAFAETLAERLNRPYCSVVDTSDELHPLIDDETIIFSTHSFNILAQMVSYNNPILIRCTRRNLIEQCLSHLISTKINNQLPDNMRFWNDRRDENRIENRNKFYNFDPFLVTKKEVFDYLNINQSWKKNWNLYSQGYRNYTVYYEDLCEKGINIPELELYNFSITEGATTKQLQSSYKERVLLNHMMIRNWVDEYQDIH